VEKHEMKRQRRSKTMSNEIKWLIAETATSNSKNREDLAEELLNQIKTRYPSEIPPTTETIIKLISKYRNHSRPPLDRPFNLGELADFPDLALDSESISRIFEVKTYMRKEGNPLPLTFRQAKWISILHRIKVKNTHQIPYLWFSSFTYANYEIICEIAGTSVDTHKLDLSLLDVKAFIAISQEIQNHEFGNQAFKKGFYFNTSRYYSENKEVI
jgi:hypothetical protein